MSGLSFAISGAIRGYADFLKIVRQADILIWGYSARLKAFGSTVSRAIIPNITKAITAVRGFNLACLANPIGLVVAGIVVGAFTIYKFWKPLTAFFRGVFNGITEGAQPLKPIFGILGNTIKSIFKTIKSVFEPLRPMFTAIGEALQPLISGIKKFFLPINTEGKKAEEWGYNLGKGIAWCINKVIDLCKWFGKAITLGGRIKFKAVDTKSPVEGVNGSHANGLYRVPFDGYKAELHKNESVLTASEANEWRGLKSGKNSSITITYAPQITMPSNADNRAKDNFMQILQKHKRELAEIVESVQNRRFAGAY